MNMRYFYSHSPSPPARKMKHEIIYLFTTTINVTTKTMCRHEKCTPIYIMTTSFDFENTLHKRSDERSTRPLESKKTTVGTYYSKPYPKRGRDK